MRRDREAREGMERREWREGEWVNFGFGLGVGFERDRWQIWVAGGDGDIDVDVEREEDWEWDPENDRKDMDLLRDNMCLCFGDAGVEMGCDEGRGA